MEGGVRAALEPITQTNLYGARACKLCDVDVSSNMVNVKAVVVLMQIEQKWLVAKVSSTYPSRTNRRVTMSQAHWPDVQSKPPQCTPPRCAYNEENV